MTALTAVSLFSGCGGFDLGAQQAGLRVLWANDIDGAAATAYRELLPKVEFVEGDVADVAEFPEADALIGCYPCTGFSLGARRRWHTRQGRDLRANEGNYLYRQFMRALRAVRPKYFFVENVGGMRSAEGGWFFQRQLDGFRRAGYRVTAQLVDAKDYGVPQSRERLFIVGVRREEGALKYAFPEASHGPLAPDAFRSLRDAIGSMERWPKGEYFEYPFHGHYLTRNRKRAWTEPSFTVVADFHHVPLHPMGKPMVFVGKDHWQLQGRANRRLSWRECAAIQELPDRPFEAVRGRNSDGYQDMRLRYRVVGNAVPPALARALVAPVVAFEAAKARKRSWRAVP